MNKGIFFIFLPCLVAFILIQTTHSIYGGYGGYGAYSGYGGYPYSGFQAGRYYSNARESMKTAAIFSSLVGFFVVLFLFNRTGQILG
ncbi:uncharacterized protein LOC132560059 [Ylistrum balloti]|uniref:uncharacterized protein LOC132560059 n=1 Tax=Ylistrum balloti TaxID=509963 RepID=UPI002905A7E7|nr:uncharacterized protein LOC132560059 [Ylistrum balloti]